MVLKDLLHTGLLQTFNLYKKATSGKHNNLLPISKFVTDLVTLSHAMKIQFYRYKANNPSSGISLKYKNSVGGYVTPLTPSTQAD